MATRDLTPRDLLINLFAKRNADRELRIYRMNVGDPASEDQTVLKYKPDHTVTSWTNAQIIQSVYEQVDAYEKLGNDSFSDYADNLEKSPRARKMFCTAVRKKSVYWYRRKINAYDATR